MIFFKRRTLFTDNEYFWNGGSWKVATPVFYYIFMKVILSIYVYSWTRKSFWVFLFLLHICAMDEVGKNVSVIGE